MKEFLENTAKITHAMFVTVSWFASIVFVLTGLFWMLNDEIEKSIARMALGFAFRAMYEIDQLRGKENDLP